MQEDPQDKELRELMTAMENAIAAQRRQPLH